MTNDRALLQISAESRALIRRAIGGNAGWPAYRDAQNVDMSDLTTRDSVFDACDALGIDIAAVIAAGPQPEAEKPLKPTRRGKAEAPSGAGDTYAAVIAIGEAAREPKPHKRPHLHLALGKWWVGGTDASRPFADFAAASLFARRVWEAA